MALALDIILTYGLRLDELMFPPSTHDPDGDPAGPRLVWMKGRKLDVPHEIPLLAEHAREIAARVGRAQAAGLPSIWFYETRKGELIPITKAGLQARLNSAADRAGVSAGRRIHGGRHHALTMFHRETKDIKLTQAMGGHLDPASTMRYVHAADREAVRATVGAMVDLLVDPAEGEKISVSVSGYLSWRTESEFTTASVSVSASLAK